MGADLCSIFGGDGRRVREGFAVVPSYNGCLRYYPGKYWKLYICKIVHFGKYVCDIKWASSCVEYRTDVEVLMKQLSY